jgi:hypothetical protein
MLDKFQDCLFENDLSVLIISGSPTQEDLQAAWDKIYVQYCQLSQDSSYNEVFETIKEINDLRAKIYLIDGIIVYLQLSYSKELIDILNVFALRCTIKQEDTGAVLADKLNTVLGRAKKWNLKLKQKQGDLEKLRTKSTGKLDRNYFDDQLFEISKFNGYHIKASDITVSQFCRSLNKIVEHYQREEFKNKTR